MKYTKEQNKKKGGGILLGKERKVKLIKKQSKERNVKYGK
jgi:hypothetical protein